MSVSIGFTYDLRDDYLAQGYREEDVAEFDSPSTIEAVAGTLSELGYSVDRIGNLKSLCARLVAGDRWDLVFNIAEGRGGRCREAQVPALLEAYDIPYTLSDPLVCALTLDKAFAKRVVHAAGINTPRFRLVSTNQDVDAVDLTFPLFVKPNGEGTGMGIDARSRVNTRAELRDVCRALLPRFTPPLLVEEFLPGREFTVGILETGPDAWAIGTMEVEFLPQAGEAIYSFENKEQCESRIRYSALREPQLKQAVEALAVGAYRILECRDAGRVDVRLDGHGRPSFIEVNPLAGLHPTHSDLPMIATQEGMPFPELVGSIVTSALRRTGGEG